MNHPTTSIEPTVDVTAIVLVGPPATGKSTIRRMFQDLDVPGCDLDEHHQSGRIVNSAWEFDVVEAIDMARESTPRLCCVEGPIEEKQTDFIREKTAGTLVIHVDANNRGDYVTRYVERELSNLEWNEREMVSKSDIESLKTRVTRRYQVEAPYPTHDVSITNSDELSAIDLSRKCCRIIQAMTGEKCDIVAPDTVADSN